MKKSIELDAPAVSTLEKKHLSKCIDSGFVSTFGPFVPEFEKRFARYIGVKRAIATQSGTAAIHIALHELGISKGDEVIIPALTFIATANPVLYTGAKPVFADVDIKTWNIDPKQVRKKITKKTRAIIPVHLYGNPCKMDEIMDIAKRHNIHVIEDATESLGSKYKNKHTGTFGKFGCFSFNGNKLITTGGGGMVAGNDIESVEHIKFLVNQARDESKGYYHPEIGFNYRMTNIEAALGLAQMTRLKAFLDKKERIYRIYKKELGGMDFICFQEEYEYAKAAWWLVCVIFKKDNLDVELLRQKLKRHGIPSRRLFMPLVEFPPYRKFAKGRYDNAYNAFNRGLCLPSSTLNSEDYIHRVCRVLKKFVSR